MILLRYILVMIFCVFAAFAGKAQTATIIDSGFRKCLVDSFPTAMDASENLILSEAISITKIECANYGIETIDELLYFPALIKLNITKNPIATLPDISGLTGLTELNIGETKITVLPDFSKLPNLKQLSFHRLYLTQFPDLSGNQKLVELYAHTNRFESIPTLNLPLLERLDVSLTSINKLPDLSYLKKLRQLDCFRNSIKELPDLTTYSNLLVVDATNNLIEQFPKLPTQVSTIRIDNNLISTLPDLSAFTALTDFRLYKNYLSFEDLIPLTTLPNYSLYQITPQKNLPVGTNQTVGEFESFTLDSKVDTNVAGVSRKWYFNGVATNNTDRFYRVSKANVTDQGAYYCELTNPAIPGLTLKTDNFNVIVTPCVNVLGISYEVTPGTCLKQGAVKINLSNQPRSDYKFELEGVQNHKVISSSSNQFSNLEELEYKLTVTAANGCKYSIPSIVEVPRENCPQLVITPNGDGVDDSYYFNQSGNAKVVDKFGNTVGQLSLPRLWDGYLNDQRISVGYYLININNGEEILKISVIY